MAKYNNLIIPSDTEGVGFWRFNMANYLIWQQARTYNIANSLLQLSVSDPNFYINFDSIMFQMQTSEESLKYIFFLRNIANQTGTRLIYNTDDVMYGPDIPFYNKGKIGYMDKKLQSRLKTIFDLCDYVVVTTDKIKEYYCQRYNLPSEKVIRIPNLLPRWWIGGKYNLNYSVEKFKSHRKNGKIRVGIISSGSHWNINENRVDANGRCVMKVSVSEKETKWLDEDLKEVDGSYAESLPYATDDMDTILDAIDKTIDVVQWVVVGQKDIRQLKKYGDKIQYVGGSGIMHYPHLVMTCQLDAIVVPCKKDEIFNQCKSNIKWLECCALGIPAYTQNVNPTYSKYVPARQMFNDSDELVERIKDLTTMSVGRYQNIVDSQWKWLNCPCVESDIELANWWMEDNMDVTWRKLWSVPQRMTPTKLKLIKEKELKKLKKVHQDGDCEIYV